jgi:hypothetical protein
VLCTTRGVGDWGYRPATHASPEVQVWRFQDGDIALLASDGAWRGANAWERLCGCLDTTADALCCCECSDPASLPIAPPALQPTAESASAPLSSLHVSASAPRLSTDGAQPASHVQSLSADPHAEAAPPSPPCPCRSPHKPHGPAVDAQGLCLACGRPPCHYCLDKADPVINDGLSRAARAMVEAQDVENNRLQSGECTESPDVDVEGYLSPTSLLDPCSGLLSGPCRHRAQPTRSPATSDASGGSRLSVRSAGMISVCGSSRSSARGSDHRYPQIRAVAPQSRFQDEFSGVVLDLSPVELPERRRMQALHECLEEGAEGAEDEENEVVGELPSTTVSSASNRCSSLLPTPSLLHRPSGPRWQSVRRALHRRHLAEHAAVMAADAYLAPMLGFDCGGRAALGVDQDPLWMLQVQTRGGEDVYVMEAALGGLGECDVHGSATDTEGSIVTESSLQTEGSRDPLHVDVRIAEGGNVGRGLKSKAKGQASVYSFGFDGDDLHGAKPLAIHEDLAPVPENQPAGPSSDEARDVIPLPTPATRPATPPADLASWQLPEAPVPRATPCCSSMGQASPSPSPVPSSKYLDPLRASPSSSSYLVPPPMAPLRTASPARSSSGLLDLASATDRAHAGIHGRARSPSFAPLPPPSLGGFSGATPSRAASISQGPASRAPSLVSNARSAASGLHSGLTSGTHSATGSSLRSSRKGGIQAPRNEDVADKATVFGFGVTTAEAVTESLRAVPPQQIIVTAPVTAPPASDQLQPPASAVEASPQNPPSSVPPHSLPSEGALTVKTRAGIPATPLEAVQLVDASPFAHETPSAERLRLGEHVVAPQWALMVTPAGTSPAQAGSASRTPADVTPVDGDAASSPELLRPLSDPLTHSKTSSRQASEGRSPESAVGSAVGSAAGSSVHDLDEWLGLRKAESVPADEKDDDFEIRPYVPSTGARSNAEANAEAATEADTPEQETQRARTPPLAFRGVSGLPSARSGRAASSTLLAGRTDTSSSLAMPLGFTSDPNRPPALPRQEQVPPPTARVAALSPPQLALPHVQPQPPSHARSDPHAHLPTCPPTCEEATLLPAHARHSASVATPHHAALPQPPPLPALLPPPSSSSSSSSAGDSLTDLSSPVLLPEADAAQTQTPSETGVVNLERLHAVSAASDADRAAAYAQLLHAAPAGTPHDPMPDAAPAASGTVSVTGSPPASEQGAEEPSRLRTCYEASPVLDLGQLGIDADSVDDGIPTITLSPASAPASVPPTPAAMAPVPPTPAAAAPVVTAPVVPQPPTPRKQLKLNLSFDADEEDSAPMPPAAPSARRLAPSAAAATPRRLGLSVDTGASSTDKAAPTPPPAPGSARSVKPSPRWALPDVVEEDEGIVFESVVMPVIAEEAVTETEASEVHVHAEAHLSPSTAGPSRTGSSYSAHLAETEVALLGPGASAVHARLSMAEDAKIRRWGSGVGSLSCKPDDAPAEEPSTPRRPKQTSAKRKQVRSYEQTRTGPAPSAKRKQVRSYEQTRTGPAPSATPGSGGPRCDLRRPPSLVPRRIRASPPSAASPQIAPPPKPKPDAGGAGSAGAPAGGLAAAEIEEEPRKPIQPRTRCSRCCVVQLAKTLAATAAQEPDCDNISIVAIDLGAYIRNDLCKKSAPQ